MNIKCQPSEGVAPALKEPDSLSGLTAVSHQMAVTTKEITEKLCFVLLGRLQGAELEPSVSDHSFNPGLICLVNDTIRQQEDALNDLFRLENIIAELL